VRIGLEKAASPLKWIPRRARLSHRVRIGLEKAASPLKSIQRRVTGRRAAGSSVFQSVS
jgi:hypothetical protein